MKYRSENKPATKGFSLIEAVAAVAILGLICSSVLVVINRSVASAADSALRMQAFEIARENMEKLLVSDEISEKVEYGISEQYPEIQWQTKVETFYEPITKRMWIQGICSAECIDVEGELRTVELTHWLTDLTKEQLLKIAEEKRKQMENLQEHAIETAEEAADYAGVDEQTIQQWLDNGMPLTDEGYFIKDQLDLYRATNGRPTDEDKEQHEKNKKQLPRPDGQEGDTEPEPTSSDDDPLSDDFPSKEEFENMTMEELMEYITKTFR